jgi:hypothetical protein
LATKELRQFFCSMWRLNVSRDISKEKLQKSSKKNLGCANVVVIASRIVTQEFFKSH